MKGIVSKSLSRSSRIATPFSNLYSRRLSVYSNHPSLDEVLHITVVSKGLGIFNPGSHEINTAR